MATPLSLPKVYTHSTTGDTLLLQHLLSLLPATLPLVRRLQFHLQTDHAVILSTLPPETPAAESAPEQSAPPVPKSPASQSPPTTHFAACYVDRSRTPETECWLFSTAELLHPPPSIGPATSNAAAFFLHRAHVLALLAHIRTLSDPLPAPNLRLTRAPHLLLTGAMHGTTLSLLKHDTPATEYHIAASFTATRADSSRSHFPTGNARGVVSGHTIPYAKYIFYPPPPSSHLRRLPSPSGTGANDHASSTAAPATQPSSQLLPAGLRWSPLSTLADFEIVVSRTHITRLPRTLSMLPNVAVQRVVTREGDVYREDNTAVLEDGGGGGDRAEGVPVGWAFLGPDASLTSLHVEPEWRGMGLAKRLAERAFGLLLDSGDAGGGDGEGNLRGGSLDEDIGGVASKEVTASGREGTAEKREGGARGNRGGFVGVRPELAFAHSDVARDNEASAGVAKALGGKEGWDCFWVLVDLDAVGKVVERCGG